MTSNTASPANDDGLQLSDDAMIEKIVEERMALRFEAEAFHWRLRLVAVETCMMGMLVIVAGLILKQPAMLVLRAGLLVAGSCFATGILLASLSAATGRLLTRIRKALRR
ncbi:hypothetical protein [Novosphingobium sp. KA1]|uniref:hypothetical protein n=1 Tax=Novosphingobium sp. (strain KA1) TaxID=164608 RepID=UPI001A8E8F2E|nr:hypothetical protein [Novosphingobium sp. KA1]QSR19701.1 hypothetical protein CA833_21395 [Novosphingobium sp. KA1]